jgi:hypothetical protein
MPRQLITGMHLSGRPWFATHAQVAALAKEAAG